MGLELRHKIYTTIFYAIELIFFPIYMWNFIVDNSERFCFSRFLLAIVIVHSLMQMISENPINRLELISQKISNKTINVLGDLSVVIIFSVFIILKITLIKLLF